MFALRALALPVVALCLASASPVISQTASTVPADTIARAKFPQEDARFVDALAAVNSFVNSNMAYEDDQKHYGYGDFWVTAPQDGKGDCEDYVLTKLFLLTEAGFPAVTNAKIVLVVVHHGGKSYGHAILAILMPKGSVAYLDMRQEPMTKAELIARGYQFQTWGE